jgi:hypothetical protein
VSIRRLTGSRDPQRALSANRIALSTWMLGVALMATGALLLITSRSVAIAVGALPRGVSAVWESILALTFLTIGALVAAHRPSNVIGWTFCAAGLTSAFAFAAEQYGLYARHVRHGALPWGTVIAWAGWIVFPALASALAALFLLFPDGRLLSRRWRPAAWLVAGAIVATSWETALAPLPRYLGTNPVKLTGMAAAVVRVLDPFIWLVVMPAAMLAAVAALVLRFRRSRGDERQQLKWLVYAGALLVLPFITAIALDLLSELGWVPPGWVDALEKPISGLFLLAIVAMPVAAGVAILKYRLYDIDRLINRTVVYATLTAVLGLGYAASVLVMGQLLGRDRSNLAVAGATLVMAAMFQPLRRRVQQAVDRRFNRRKYDAAKTIEAFSARLREEIDLDSLASELLAVVRQTMQPTTASLWLRPPPHGAGVHLRPEAQSTHRAEQEW